MQTLRLVRTHIDEIEIDDAVYATYVAQGYDSTVIETMLDETQGWPNILDAEEILCHVEPLEPARSKF